MKNYALEANNKAPFAANNKAIRVNYNNNNNNNNKKHIKIERKNKISTKNKLVCW